MTNINYIKNFSSLILLGALLCIVIPKCSSSDSSRNRLGRGDNENDSKKNIPLSVDSLLSSKNKNQEKIEELQSLSNLNTLNGYRGLILGMLFDSISFDSEGYIDERYLSKNIIVVNRIKSYVDILGTQCGIELTFYNRKLEIIDFHNTCYNIDLLGYPNIPQNPHYDIFEPLRSFKSMFGVPNNRNSVISNDKVPSMESLISSVSCEWEINNIQLTYEADRWYSTRKHNPVLTSINISLIIKDIRYNSKIKSLLQLVNDSLKMVKQKQDKEDFIKQF